MSIPPLGEILLQCQAEKGPAPPLLFAGAPADPQTSALLPPGASEDGASRSGHGAAA